MAVIELVMPKMGESIIEATILSWNKSVGDKVEVDETVLEIATDKVDSEVPSPTEGVIKEIKFDVDAVVAVGEVIALIETDGGGATAPASVSNIDKPSEKIIETVEAPLSKDKSTSISRKGADGRFYSPLVRKIAEEEGLTQLELDSISGSGHEGRVNKSDVLAYIASKGVKRSTASSAATSAAPVATKKAAAPVAIGQGDEIIEMDRMRRLIADHMVGSKHTSPHVTSFVEADVTNIVNWRNANKVGYQKKYGEKITFTPIFIEAIVKAIADFPMINVSVDGHNIIKRKHVNIGMAAALPSGNLIVPVIKDANHLSLTGLTAKVNDLAARARGNNLKPDEIQGGTFTITNVGTFGNVMGTPIINQPQVAIMAVGAIRKKPAVLETEHGDVIAIRQMMFLSLSYDHRVVDGMLGGSFLKRVADYLEGFDTNRIV